MKTFDVFFWVIVILPVFVLFFSKISYTLGFVAWVFDDVFNLFTYFWVDCKLVGTLSGFFSVYFLWIIILFVYHKIKV